MIKSRYDDPRFQDRGFVNHIHHAVFDAGNAPDGSPLIESYKIEMVSNLQSTSGTGAKPRNLALFRRVGDAPWHLLKMWQEGSDYNDASAAGSVDVAPDGTVSVVMSFGKTNASGALTFQPWEASIPRAEFAPPIVRPTLGGSADALEQRLAALATHLADVEAVMHETQNETARVRALAESIGGESLSAGDREALDRLRAMLRI